MPRTHGTRAGSAQRTLQSVLAFLMLPAVAWAGEADAAKPKLSDAAAAAIRKAWPNATVKEVSVEQADPGAPGNLHKAVLREGDKEWEVEVSPGGVIISTQTDVELADLPKDVKSAVDKAVGDGKVGKVEKEVIFAEVRDGKVVKLPAPRVIYEAKYTRTGMRGEIKIAADSPAEAKDAWRSTFDVDKKNLVSVGRNPYFILVPGYRLHFKEEDGDETLVISVLDETKMVDGVETRVVEEREHKNGKLAEVSRNYFAIDKKTNDVYYFGEDVDEYRGGKVVSHGGAWLSGVKGARFGLIMPGKPKVGDKYYQEVAPNVAMDRAEIVSLNAKLKTPYKAFTECLYVRETSPLESGVSRKWYVAGIGLVGDDDLRLVKVEAPKPAKE